MDGCGITSSCQSTATLDIVKRCCSWVCNWRLRYHDGWCWLAVPHKFAFWVKNVRPPRTLIYSTERLFSCRKWYNQRVACEKIRQYWIERQKATRQVWLLTRNATTSGPLQWWVGLNRLLHGILTTPCTHNSKTSSHTNCVSCYCWWCHRIQRVHRYICPFLLSFYVDIYIYIYMYVFYFYFYSPLFF